MVNPDLNNTMQLLSILLIGTGRMADTHMNRYKAIPGVTVIAAVDVDKVRVTEFCAVHSIEHAYTSTEDALRSHSYDAASIVTPDAWHAEPSLLCLDAGLAVLCEKPLSDSLDSSREMVDAAQSSGLLNMVNLSYRVSGALHQARQWIDRGRLGDVRHIEASYRQSWLCSAYWGDWKTEDAWLWRLSKNHGSMGVLGDIGIHILDFVTAGVGLDIAGLHCRLQTFSKASDNQIGDYVLDANDSCVINVEMSNGALGVVHMSRFQTGYVNDLFLTVHGTKGALKVSTGNEGDKLTVCLGEDMHSQTWIDIPCEERPDTFERFISSLRLGVLNSPDFSHAAQLQQSLDQCFESHETGAWIQVDNV